MTPNLTESEIMWPYINSDSLKLYYLAGYFYARYLKQFISKLSTFCFLNKTMKEEHQKNLNSSTTIILVLWQIPWEFVIFNSSVVFIQQIHIVVIKTHNRRLNY